MARYSLISLFVFFVLLNSNSLVFAESSYVLPYPSFMPGSKFYIIFEVKDRLSKYFYFGDFGNFKYNLSQSDKYLVEAKTLFEYGQYFLAYQALLKSDSFFERIKPSLISAKKQGKDTSDKTQILEESSRKHIEVLTKLKKELPSSYYWNPENSRAVTIELHKSIEESIRIRKTL